MDGWEFLESFKKFPRKIEVIVRCRLLVRRSREFEKNKEYQLVENYMLKPITIEDLEDILDHVA